MQAQEFFSRVSADTGTDQAEAERLSRAVLTALAQSLPRDDADGLSAQLPNPLQDWVRSASRQELALDRETFLARVSELAGDTAGDGASDAEVEGAARAVLAALREAVTFGEIGAIISALPDGLADLVATNPEA